MYVAPSIKIVTVSPTNIVCQSEGSTKINKYYEDDFDWTE